MKKTVLFITCLCSVLIAFAQTTISTSHTNNNGNGSVTFNVENTNTFDITITGLNCHLGTSATNNLQLLYRTTPFNDLAAPWDGGVVGAGQNGWILGGSGTANSNTANGVVPALSSLSITVPAGTTYQFGFSGTTIQYMSLTNGGGANINTFSGGGVNLKTGDGISWGGTAYPSTPANYPRGFIGGITFVTNPGSALSFDGGDDYVAISSTSLLSMTTAVTVEAWVKTGSSSEEYIISKSNDSYFMGINVDGNVGKASFYINGVTSSWLYSNVTNINDNNWHHIASTYDGSTVKIYIDGVLSNSAVASGTISTGANNINLGCRNNGYFLQGSLDEVRIWDIARTQCEIISYKDCEIASTETGLVANYHFNQGIDAANNPTVTTLTDASGNAHNGTLGNFSLTGSTSNWVSPGGVVSGFSTSIACPVAAAALDLDGSDDFVLMPDATINDLSSGTIETWVYLKSNTEEVICAKQHNFVGSYAILAVGTDGSPITPGKIFFSARNGSAIYSNLNLSIGQWYHIAATFNGSGANLYVNGVLDATTSGNFTVPNDLSTDGTSIGAWLGHGGGKNLDGQVDEFRVWNTARTQCEINTYMNCEIPSSTSNLVANYHFNQGLDSYSNPAIATLTDVSGNGYNGTLNNFSLTGSSSNWVAAGGVVSGYTTTLAPPVITVNSGAICIGQSFTMTPTGALTYTYSNGFAVATPTADATYSVSGTDANGCMSAIDAVASVTVNALPTISVNSGAICLGQSFTMVPTGASTYTYSNGTDVVSPTSDATYSVSGTDANGCVSNVDAVSSVTVNALPTISVNSGAICSGQSFTMVPTGATTYTYSNGSDVAIPTSDATYTVTGADANGCENMATSSVTVNALPSITVNNGTVCTGQSFTMVPSGAATYTYSNGSDVAMPTSDATYTVTGTDANGCENMATSSVTVNALPVLSATTTSTLMCTGETATLSVTGASTYTWSTNETTSGIVVTPTTQATYTVDGTDANGCSNTTTITQDVSLCTGIISINNSQLLNVYPNPNNGSFIIDLNTASQVTVTNALGQIILTEIMGEGKNIVNIQNQSTGIYFVKVIQDGKQHMIKLIKE